MHIVEINHIKKSLDDTEVLQDISLFVDKANAAGLSYLIPRPGEVWCFD